MAAGVVCAYYVVMWSLIGRDPRRGTLVIQYEPPAGLSPSLLRYVWKESFDDRTFWAGMLSLVSKGLATLVMEENNPVFRATRGDAGRKSALPKEERFLLQKMLRRHGSRGMSARLLDEQTGYQAWGLAGVLRQAAIGHWFVDNREIVLSGAGLSLLPVLFSTQAQHLDQVLALVYALALMAPGGFYFIVLLPHFGDLIRASRAGSRAILLWRTLVLSALVVTCLAGVTAGAVILGGNFGSRVLMMAGLMVILNLTFLRLMRAPTKEGGKLLDRIEGFREFLSSVEKLPMNRPDEPAASPSLYEKYLPYAVALEVEQAWSDRFLALAETLPEWEFWEGTYCLGIMDGASVNISLPSKSNHSTRRP